MAHYDKADRRREMDGTEGALRCLRESLRIDPEYQEAQDGPKEARAAAQPTAYPA